jgi:hypothetical protein
MAAQDEAALEMEEQVLANRLDSLEQSAVEPLRKSLDLRLRMWGLDLDSLADQHL